MSAIPTAFDPLGTLGDTAFPPAGWVSAAGEILTSVLRFLPPMPANDADVIIDCGVSTNFYAWSHVSFNGPAADGTNLRLGVQFPSYTERLYATNFSRARYIDARPTSMSRMLLSLRRYNIIVDGFSDLLPARGNPVSLSYLHFSQTIAIWSLSYTAEDGSPVHLELYKRGSQYALFDIAAEKIYMPINV